ncbi:TlpA disulfide reductase family protein [Marinobacteraceae bacterium S3BR75-40.1]
MIHLIRLSLLASLTLWLTACGQPQFPTAGGEPVKWDDLRGQWVLVNYWAEWCKPCLEEIPELNALDQNPKVRVLGVNYDGKQGQALIKAAQSMGIEFTLLEEDIGNTMDWEKPLALPVTFVVDPEGKLQEARFGPQKEQELLEKMGL